jgi:hypothetical protein
MGKGGAALAPKAITTRLESGTSDRVVGNPLGLESSDRTFTDSCRDSMPKITVDLRSDLADRAPGGS